MRGFRVLRVPMLNRINSGWEGRANARSLENLIKSFGARFIYPGWFDVRVNLYYGSHNTLSIPIFI